MYYEKRSATSTFNQFYNMMCVTVSNGLSDYSYLYEFTTFRCKKKKDIHNIDVVCIDFLF